MEITAKSKVTELAAQLDSNFGVSANTFGAARLLEALASKSEVAQKAINALPAVAAQALAELGLHTAAKDVEGDPALLAAFAADVDGDETDDGEEQDAADDAQVAAMENLIGAVKSLGENVEGLADKLDEYGNRIQTLEKTRGVSRARGWQNDDADFAPATKSQNAGVWGGSAFDFAA